MIKKIKLDTTGIAKKVSNILKEADFELPHLFIGQDCLPTGSSIARYDFLRDSNSGSPIWTLTNFSLEELYDGEDFLLLAESIYKLNKFKDFDRSGFSVNVNLEYDYGYSTFELRLNNWPFSKAENETLESIYKLINKHKRKINVSQKTQKLNRLKAEAKALGLVVVEKK